MSFDPKSSTVVEGIDDEPVHKEINFFGRDVSKIPCFKESFLYGLLGGVGAGLITFTASSRVGRATNVAVYSFAGIVLFYWFNCRINLSTSKFTIAQTERALRDRDRSVTSIE